jgi:hypothetical protein
MPLVVYLAAYQRRCEQLLTRPAGRLPMSGGYHLAADIDRLAPAGVETLRLCALGVPPWLLRWAPKCRMAKALGSLGWNGPSRRRVRCLEAVVALDDAERHRCTPSDAVAFE